MIWIILIVVVFILLSDKKGIAPTPTPTSETVTNPAVYTIAENKTPEGLTEMSNKYGPLAPDKYGYDASANLYRFIGSGMPPNGNWTLPVS